MHPLKKFTTGGDEIRGGRFTQTKRKEGYNPGWMSYKRAAVKS